MTSHNGVKLEQGANMGNVGSQGGSGPNRAVTPGGHAFDPTQPGFPVFHRKFANPAPLGLMGFAATTFVLSFFNAGAKGITEPNVVVGMALGYGGLAQFLAGMWEFAAGNTFGATAFSSYGAFWFSYAIIFLPNSGILDAYTGEAEAQLAPALGFFLLSWFFVTVIFLIASLRSSVGLVGVFFFLSITFLLLTIGEFLHNTTVTKAGGAFGVITAFNAWYVALSGLLTPDTSFFMLPIGPLGPK